MTLNRVDRASSARKIVGKYKYAGAVDHVPLARVPLPQASMSSTADDDVNLSKEEREERDKADLEREREEQNGTSAVVSGLSLIQLSRQRYPIRGNNSLGRSISRCQCQRARGEKISIS